MLDVLAAAQAVQGEAMADNLHDFGAGALRQGIGRFAAGQVASVLYGAFDELVSLERLLGLLGYRIGDVGLADVDNGIEMMDQGAELPDLLAIE